MKSVRRLLSEYLTSVGHGCTLILNLNPDTSGLVPEEDRKAYEKLGKAIALLYKDPVKKSFKPRLKIGTKKIWKFTAFRSLNGSVILMEDIERYGQLVMKYELKLKTKDGWISTPELGSTIGHKRIHPFPKDLANKTVSAVSLRINKLVTKRRSIVLREVSVYNWNEAAKPGKNLI